MKQYPSRMGVGASSILLILVVVSLTLFASLCKETLNQATMFFFHAHELRQRGLHTQAFRVCGKNASNISLCA